MISIIVPALDEEESIGACLQRLQALRARGGEVIVVDGGSRDATRAIAAPLADRVLEAPRGRAAQMNAGARSSRGDILVFLHADTTLPQDADVAIGHALEGGTRAWGRFDAMIAGRDPMLRIISFFMNVRSRVSGIATGDQAIFARRSAFEAAGGFPEIALMEDIALSKALKRSSAPACLRERVITSGRRWESRGTLATILLMWRLRLAYALGADPASLAERYGDRRPSA